MLVTQLPGPVWIKSGEKGQSLEEKIKKQRSQSIQIFAENPCWLSTHCCQGTFRRHLSAQDWDPVFIYSFIQEILRLL
jgi:hypothetical protein